MMREMGAGGGGGEKHVEIVSSGKTLQNDYFKKPKASLGLRK